MMKLIMALICTVIAFVMVAVLNMTHSKDVETFMMYGLGTVIMVFLFIWSQC